MIKDKIIEAITIVDMATPMYPVINNSIVFTSKPMAKPFACAELNISNLLVETSY
jgi:hypothetical protein